MDKKFDNHISVIDTNGKHLNPSYLHRARGLVKNGRAEWVDEKTIRMISTTAQVATQPFSDYLQAQGMKPPYIEKNTALADKFHGMLGSDSPTENAIAIFVDNIRNKGIKGDGTGRGEGAAKSAYQFLDKYAEFCGDDSVLAQAYHAYLREGFEEPARRAVNAYKQAIVFIPMETRIDPFFLDGLTNDEFVTAFASLQHLVYGIYEEVERTTPFEWGWTGWPDGAAYGVWHNRIWGLLGAFAQVGQLDNDVLVVDKKVFYNHPVIKKQNQLNSKTKANMMIAGLMDMGLAIEGFDDKQAKTFIVSCPDTPHLISVLKAYFKERRRECCQCHKVEVYPCTDNCDVTIIGHHVHFISYRFVEQHPPQTHDTEVLLLAVADSAPEELRKIQHYLHHEAVKHGFQIPPWTPMHGGAMQHWKYTTNWGSKMWPTVGSGTSWMDFFYTQSTGKWTLKAELKSKKYNGTDGTVVLQNPTLDEAKTIVELFISENKIKPV